MVNVGVIGYGYWGPNLVRNYEQMPESNLVACCDLNPDNLKKVKALYPKVEVTQQIDDLLNNPSIDAVVIASSAATHFDLAKKALLAGKHAMVEKPLTLSSDTSRELIDIADKAGCILMVGHLLEYHSAVDYMRGLIDSGELGDIQYLYTQRLNLGQVRTDENALWSLAPHDISIIFYLLGGKEPAEVSARGQSYITEGIEDVVFCSISFKDKTMAHIHVSWLDPHKTRKLTVVGNKKMAVFDDMESSEKIRIYDKGVGVNPDYRTYGEDLTLRFGDITIPSIKMKEPLRAECEHFIQSIQTGQRPRSDGYNGLRVVKVLEAAQKSLKSGGKPVTIAEG
ncbi:MAG: gfo/Idh/MocA family oxidoreductase [Candidatus Aquicultor secundus]|uniref:Gfo/Idh/MocA family oxidoreductase n=1 Tax=Candidatus Aquicultor secundus TaxID=1973895 RepID=A0A2M7TAP7_9ACTN|nr:Gfo/Idh/MocA family oxidoreductase [Candidatus Aquicultor secundus]NCO65769.1 Gfo/Idh/MocA family oxidoreductase [Solirubrobacter sp.]OIO86099.1 MAG: oxidoreductase [Candidatus Aquicultor secundus]PIU26976.1 MAG: gfo/Idh/MocA family oxidoreductase [Candidatus Aquicultor secundus]PIW22327.1 MAG: gfo/Idh/MocA family oxidoreductase [Candidatus Aquicultor secundus]PIX51392.1 MAG: gfo/Idh/MocA family oxidoreductase [Candidatus Aquicultor secundus]